MQKHIVSIVESVLNEDMIRFELGDYKIEESVTEKQTFLSCEVKTQFQTYHIFATGSGIVDAFFEGMKKELSPECQTLDEIKFHSFSTKALINRRKHDAHTNSAVKCDLTVLNSKKQERDFTVEDFSMVTASLKVVAQMFEYFVNVEWAVKRLHHAIKDAEERNRTDLIVRYTNELALLVTATDYSKVIQGERK